jgi:hypothetical protein
MRYATVAVLAVFAATVAITVADEAFVLAGAASYPNLWAALNNAVTGAESLVFGAVGALILVRRGNAVGWLLSAMGLLVATLAVTSSYPGLLSPATEAEIAAEPVWLAPWWVWVGSVAWLSAVTLVAVFVQVFPDGRPLTPRWRPALGLTLAWPVLFLAVNFLSPTTLENGRSIANPNGLGGAPGEVMLAVETALGPVFVVGFGVAFVSVLLRFRRSAGRQRAQLKWFAYAAGVGIACFMLSGLFLPRDASDVVNGVFLSVLPLSVGAAILRHGLYDIDVVIERTLVYGATTAAIAVAFFGGIVLLQAALRPLTGGSELAVAGSTLVSFALFQPIRRWIQATVDRRFYRSRYDAVRTLDAFSVQLRDEVDLDAVRTDLVNAVQRSVQPTHASVWLREQRS